jgi:uncharacterized protein DUF6932
VPLPAFTQTGDLPPGIHRATLAEVLARFGTQTPRRRVVGTRLERIYQVAVANGQVARFIVFGSFITAKPEPNDVDVFLLMVDAFEVGSVSGEARLLFDHAAAQAHLGASVFWLRRLAALGGDEAAVEYWGIKRDGGVRGIVEIIPESL